MIETGIAIMMRASLSGLTWYRRAGGFVEVIDAGLGLTRLHCPPRPVTQTAPSGSVRAAQPKTSSRQD
ncbi:MAG: hypothetical protein R2693_03225 [Nocardioidaceae bacterium]